MLKHNKKVLVHCTSGITRSATLIIAYLCLFKPFKLFERIDDASQLVKRCLPGATPNLEAVQLCLQKYEEIEE